MVVLKKIKASTLIENLVASVIIVVVFSIATLSLNNVFKITIIGNTSKIETRMNELEYLLINNKISLPYAEQFGDWGIQILKSGNKNNFYELKSNHKQSKKQLVRQLSFVK